MIASKKSKTVNESHEKWSQFGPVSETWGLAQVLRRQSRGLKIERKIKKRNKSKINKSTKREIER